MGRESGFQDMRGEGILCRAYGARDSFCQLAQPLRAGLTCVAPTALPIVAAIFTQPLRAGLTCVAPTALPIVASILTQPLRAGLTYVAPTALFGSENSSQLEPPKRPGKLILVLTRRLLSW